MYMQTCTHVPTWLLSLVNLTDHGALFPGSPSFHARTQHITLDPPERKTYMYISCCTYNVYVCLEMQVIGQGNVQLHQASLSSDDAQGTKKLTAVIPIVASSVPRVKVLGVIAKDDGELVADVIELPVSCELEHKVREGVWLVEERCGLRTEEGGGRREGQWRREKGSYTCR